MRSVGRTMLKERKKKLLVGMSVVLGTLLMIYLGVGIFFIKHFYYNTTINGKEVGGKTTSEIEAILQNEAQNYRLVLEERGNQSEIILGNEIGYAYKLEEQVSELKKKQKALDWATKIWRQKDLKITLEPTYDDVLFKARFEQLDCFLPSNSINPEDATLVFKKDTYVIEAGDKGSLVIKDKLYKVIEEALLNQETMIDLQDKACYEVARYTTESKEMIAKREALNAYVHTQVTYNFGDRTKVLNGEEIHNWLQIDENNEVLLDEEAVKEYVRQLAITYDTLYSTRQFKTSVDSTVTVVGGDYGWRIDKEKESQILIKLLEEGKQKISREPEYEQEAWCRNAYDVGDTYVEINLTRQYLWFYKNGELITEGSIVSGTSSNSSVTPEGTYGISYKQTNAILRGPGYATPVSFWMPFNRDIGIHDATWRSNFGEDIYVYNGSHGCINTPYELAQTLFAEVEKGMPVICYKDAIRG